MVAKRGRPKKEAENLANTTPTESDISEFPQETKGLEEAENIGATEMYEEMKKDLGELKAKLEKNREERERLKAQLINNEELTLMRSTSKYRYEHLKMLSRQNELLNYIAQQIKQNTLALSNQTALLARTEGIEIE